VTDTGSWHTYPKVYELGHAAIAELLLDDVIVEEKIDGSQFSFMKAVGEDGTPFLHCRSKGADLHVEAPEKMFAKAVEVITALMPILHEGWTYRAEYLVKPKHNTLAYERTPKNHLMIFDINTGHERYLSYEEKAQEAARLGLECMPCMRRGKIERVEDLRALLDTPSVLGGQKVEGIVVKNYTRFGKDGKALMGKFVSEEFKEVHADDWKVRNPQGGDVLQSLVERYRTPARWTKAVQHLQEKGRLEGSPKDIGALINEVQEDLKAECEEEIKGLLYAWAKERIFRGSTAGLPQWYKERLLDKQFDPRPS